MTVLFVMLPFEFTSGGDADNPQRWWFLLASALGAAAFVWWERRFVAAGYSPVIDFRLFHWPSYRYGVLITTLVLAMLPPMFFVLTLYNQQGLGHTALVVGMVTIPFALTSAIAAAVSGKYTFQHATALVLSVLGLIPVVLYVEPAVAPIRFAVVLGVGGIGQGLVMSANQMRAMMHVPLISAGVGGSFMQVGQRLGNAIGIAIATSIFFSIVASVTHAGIPDPTDPQTIATYREATTASLIFVLALGVIAIVLASMDWRTDRQQKRAPRILS